MTMTQSRIDLANEFVSVIKVLRWSGTYVPEVSYGRSWKTRCPFGEFYHLDRGSEKCLRVYSDTNSAYCFQGCGYITPVSLYSKVSGLTWPEAAEELLKREGYEEISDSEKWKQASEQRKSIDPNYLSSALQVYCSKIAKGQWNSLQYDSLILGNLKNCLDLLSLVTTEERARDWLSSSKSYMLKGIAAKVENESV